MESHTNHKGHDDNAIVFKKILMHVDHDGMINETAQNIVHSKCTIVLRQVNGECLMDETRLPTCTIGNYSNYSVQLI